MKGKHRHGRVIHLSYYDGRQRRALRFKAYSSMKAVLASRPCDVLNISVSGALVLVDTPLATGRLHPLQLGVAADVIALTARVVRTTPSSEPRSLWETAITFCELSQKAHLQIAPMLTHLLQPFGRLHYDQPHCRESRD